MKLVREIRRGFSPPKGGVTNCGGTGNWSDNTNHWASSSGGAPGASKPTSADNVFFDSASHTAAYTMTVNETASCADMTFAAPASGDVTWAGTFALDVFGSFTLYASLVRSFTGNLNFKGTGSHAITTAGVTLFSIITITNANGSYTLQDAFNNTTRPITHQDKTFDTNGFTVTCSTFTSNNSNTRTITLGASTFNCRQWVTTNVNNLTFNANTSTIAVTALAFSYFDSGNISFYNLSFSSAGYYETDLSGNFTVSNNFTVTGADANAQRLKIGPSSMTAQRTITCNGTVSLTNVDFENIIGAGSASWASGTSIGDCGDNSGITFTAAVDRFWVGGTGSFTSTSEWSASSGGGSGASMPLPQDTAYFDANSFSGAGQTVTPNVNRLRLPKMVWTGATNTPTLNLNQPIRAFGDITLISGMTFTVSQPFHFKKHGVQNLTSAGKSFANDVTVLSNGGTLTLLDTYSCTGTMTVQSGNFDLNDQDATLLSFQTAGTLSKVISLGSGDITITSNALPISFSTGLTLNAETSTIYITDASSSTKTIAQGGYTFNNVVITGGASATFAFTGNGTYNTFQVLNAPCTLSFGNLTTLTFAEFLVSGTAGNLIGITTSASMSFVKTGNGWIDSSYLSVQNCNATPAFTWFAGLDSTDVSGNSGWVFNSPYACTAFLTFF